MWDYRMKRLNDFPLLVVDFGLPKVQRLCHMGALDILR